MDYKDKIRKLLALAKSPEPEEAKLALLKARKLMAEHKLTERDLEEHDTTVIQQEIDETFSKKANSWMSPLSTVIGENYCCAAYQKMKQEYDGSVRNPYCRRWTHRAIVRSFKKKFR